MNADKVSFLSEIQKELVEENVAIFAGAGMSAGAGYVNWAELLRPIAVELGLDVEKEHDLVALAQYHCNSNGGNRSQLNKRLVEEFSRNAVLTKNHKILSRLPITTFWTTNYDKLIESALSAAGKIPDVKYTRSQLANTKPKRDAIVYKMHGDVEHPSDAVLTKDDYEKYHIKMDQFLSALKGDLISKTFIFIGFSFTDPNLDYILSRVRVAFEANQRRHYCFIKAASKSPGDTDADFEYRVKKQQYFIEDLRRFNVKSIIINDYNEITDLLTIIEMQFKKKTIFISGAAHDYGKWDEKSALNFTHKLSSMLISQGYRIVSGFGLGVGSAVIAGALEKIYMEPNSNVSDQLILRPFPQASQGKIPLPELWQMYREDMISHAGIAIFVFGNKKSNDDKLVESDGMLKEYEIAKKNGLLVIPIGMTGFVAKRLWDIELEILLSDSNVSEKIKETYSELGGDGKSLNDAIETLQKLLELMA